MILVLVFMVALWGPFQDLLGWAINGLADVFLTNYR